MGLIIILFTMLIGLGTLMYQFILDDSFFYTCKKAIRERNRENLKRYLQLDTDSTSFDLRSSISNIRHLSYRVAALEKKVSERGKKKK